MTAAGENTRSPTQPSEITTPSIAQASEPLPSQPVFTNGVPFVNGHHPPQQVQHPQQIQPLPVPGQPQYLGPQPQYAGPSGGRVYFSNEENPDQMDVDRPSSTRPGQAPVPTTLDMLERARAAQARAGSAVHSQSPATSQYFPPPQSGQPQYLQPGQQPQLQPQLQPQPQSFGAPVNGRNKNTDEKS
jgi:hypothetical protein